ncbi:hypothetical protein [Cuniculiplasma divulgatum]|nr:hypothetical protein [Cuniculiplasma divulgatum]
MNERPKGVSNIHEVDGNKDVIVIVPTIDFNGKFARECRENIFKGLHIVFVESGKDYYFNFAHNCNVGIKKSLEYDPKWIIVSNDDMVKIDTAKLLQEQLLALNEKKYDVIFTQPSKYHSSSEKISRPNILFFVYSLIMNKNCGRTALKMYKKFLIRYLISPISGKFSKLFKNGYQYLEIQDFGIFSSLWISKVGGSIYDETFINAAEDTDLSIRIKIENARTMIIDYKIGDLIGSTLDTGNLRAVRSIAGLTYLNWKWDNKKNVFNVNGST